MSIAEFLSSNLASFLWGLSAFVVFVLVFYRLGVKHILAAVDARDAKIRNEMAESESAYQKAKGIQEALDAKMRGAEAKIQELMNSTRKSGEMFKAEQIDKGRAEIEAFRVKALREIEAARHAALVELKHEVADIAAIIAEKILRERIDAAKQEELVAQTTEAYEANKGTF